MIRAAAPAIVHQVGQGVVRQVNATDVHYRGQ